MRVKDLRWSRKGCGPLPHPAAKVGGWFSIESFSADVCRSNVLFTRLLVQNDRAQAALNLEDARAFANRSGQVEFQLRCFQAACELSATSAITLNPSKNAKPASSWQTLAASENAPSTSAWPSPKRTSPSATPVNASKMRATRSTAPNFRIADMPGEKPTASTSAVLPTSALASASWRASASPPRYNSESASVTDASRRPAALLTFAGHNHCSGHPPDARNTTDIAG